MAIEKNNLRRVPRLVGWTLLLCCVAVGYGCATSQKVNIEVLETCKTKTFKLGVVKAAGSTAIPFEGSRISEKKRALEKIPIEDVCQTLHEKYALKIDTNISKVPNVVKERTGSSGTSQLSGQTGFSINLQPTTENAYYGNLEYDNASTLWLMLGGNSKVTNENGVPDVVNLTYSMEDDPVPFSFRTRFLYSIRIKSSGQDVLGIKGIVDTIPTPNNGLVLDPNGLWDEYVKYAGRINDALKRDLAEAPKR